MNHTEKLIYRTNHLTSTLFAVDKDGAVALHMMYDEWGNPQVDTKFNINKSGVSNLNNYTGYTYDDVLGIYYAQARFYDAGIKRFIQEDPIKDGMNWYAYVGNNPVNMVDPWGLFRDGDILGYDYGVYKADNVLLQKKLSEMNLYHGAIDGMFGTETQRAMQRFQSESTELGNPLNSTGVVDAQTWRALGLPVSVAPRPNILASEAIIGTGDNKTAVSYLFYDSKSFIIRLEVPELLITTAPLSASIVYRSEQIDYYYIEGHVQIAAKALKEYYGGDVVFVNTSSWISTDFAKYWNNEIPTELNCIL